MAMVCSCHAVTERKIARAIDQGARCVDDVAGSCWAGSNCGGCHDAIESMIAARLCASMGSPAQVIVRMA